MMKSLAILAHLLLMVAAVSAQAPVFKQRIEPPINTEYMAPAGIALGENGFILAAISEESKGQSGTVRIWYYDKALKLVKQLDQQVAVNPYQIQLFGTQSTVYLATTGYKCRILFHRIEVPSMKVTPFATAAEDNCFQFDPAILGNRMVCRAPLDNKVGYAEFALSGGASLGNTELATRNDRSNSLQVDTINDLVGCMVEKNYIRPSLSHHYKVFEHGKPIVDLDMDAGQENKLVSATFAKLPDGSLLVAGTYHRKDFAGEEGLYIANIKSGTIAWVKYHHFTSFKHYFDYRSERGKEVIESKTARANERGTDPLLKHHLCIHNLYAVNGKYYFVGEVYYPDYMESGNGGTVLAGNVYTHAVIACIDPKGGLVWDQMMELALADKPKEFFLATETMFLKDRIIMFYGSSNTVGYKAFDYQGNVVLPYAEAVIENGPGGDNYLGSTCFSTPWYGGRFLVYGRQLVKNGSAKRNAIFIEEFTTSE